ncbi:MAG: hypothetical protein ABR601_11340 [Parasphingopyxis sp.]|nr:hypothetical protein [Sphingomonadales bacterium]
MLALGCLLPLIFGLGGLLLGAWLGGDAWTIWGGIIGLLLGTVPPILTLVALAKAKGKR